MGHLLKNNIVEQTVFSKLMEQETIVIGDNDSVSAARAPGKWNI